MNPADTPILYSARTEPEGLEVDAYANQSLLISLEQGGSNWPSSCRNGTCRTCIGQLRSGQVRYEVEWPGITTEEQNEGNVLPCIAYPCSDVVLRQGY